MTFHQKCLNNKGFKLKVLGPPVNPVWFDSFVLERNWFNIHEMTDFEGNRNIDRSFIEKETDWLLERIDKEIDIFVLQ